MRVLLVCLFALTLNATAQQRAKECRNFDDNSLRYNAALKEYNEHKISYKEFLKVSEKTRLSLKGCIIKDKDRMTDQEYYGKLYVNGLFLMNNGMYDEALSFFEQIAVTDLSQTRTLSLSGKSLTGLSKEKKELCKQLRSSVEQGKYIYATVWFRGKSSYMAAILSDKMYKHEVKESLEAQPYFDFEIDQLKAHVYPLADSAAALKYFAVAYGQFNNDLQADYAKSVSLFQPAKARWDALKTELNDFNEAHRSDTSLYMVRKIQILNTDLAFTQKFGYLTLEANLGQQLNAPFLFIPGPGYFDLFKSMIKEQNREEFGPVNFNGYALGDNNFPENLKTKTRQACDENFVLYQQLVQRPVYPYLNHLYEDQRAVGRRYNYPEHVNNYSDAVSSASAFYNFLLNYLVVEKPVKDIIPVYLCGRNLIPEDYRRYSDFNREVSFRYASGKPGSYNAPANSILYWAASGPGTLNHELLHTVIATDFPGIPYWLNEGMASMFEETSFNYKTEEGHRDELGTVDILPNFRSTYLAAFYDKFHRDISIADLLSSQTYDEEIVNSIKDAYDRYFCYFLYDSKYLSAFYQALRKSGNAGPENQLQVLAAVTGRSIAELDKEWVNWLDHFDGSRGSRIVHGSEGTYRKEHPDTTSYLRPVITAPLPATAVSPERQVRRVRPTGAGQGDNSVVVSNTDPPSTGDQSQHPAQPAVHRRQRQQQQQRQEVQNSGILGDWLDNIGSVFRADPKKSTVEYRITKQVNALSAYPFGSRNEAQ